LLSVSTLSVTLLGFLLGLRHAFDADHLAAVVAIASERKSITGSMMVGMFWGLGHTLALLGAGIAVILLRVEISAGVSHVLELAVAVMLVALGTSGLGKVLRARAAAEGSSVGAEGRHHGNEGLLQGRLAQGIRPFAAGLVHGLAGSAALMLVVLSAIPSPAVGLAYVALFGIGSIAGMAGVGALLAAPATLATRYFQRADMGIRTAAALFSLGLGLMMILRIA
jgi:sulfite exporter TauE/SafE